MIYRFFKPLFARKTILKRPSRRCFSSKDEPEVHNDEVDEYLLCAIDARSIDRLKTQYCYPVTLKFRDINIEQKVYKKLIGIETRGNVVVVRKAFTNLNRFSTVQQSARQNALFLHDLYSVYLFGHYRWARNNSTIVSIHLPAVIPDDIFHCYNLLMIFFFFFRSYLLLGCLTAGWLTIALSAGVIFRNRLLVIKHFIPHKVFVTVSLD